MPVSVPTQQDLKLVEMTARAERDALDHRITSLEARHTALVDRVVALEDGVPTDPPVDPPVDPPDPPVDPPDPPPPGDVIQIHHESVPRFVGASAVHSVRSGSWTDPEVWSDGVVPGDNAQVRIQPDHVVSYAHESDVRLDAVEVLGLLSFSVQQSSRMYVNELQVLSGGTLMIGRHDTPVQPTVTAEIIFNNIPDADGRHFKTGTVEDPGQDPSQYGCGLLVINGECVIHGAPLSRTFVRLDHAPVAGDTTLHLAHPVSGWKVGDRLILPDTRQVSPVNVPRYWTYEPHWEELEIASIINGKTVTLASPLQYDHPQAFDAGGTPTPGMLPHVANLTRNVIIRSEDSDGVHGHTQFFMRSRCDVRYALFQDLGRTRAEPLDSTTRDENGFVNHIGTNQIARYPVHHHHLWGPTGGLETQWGVYQSVSVGNCIIGSGKWGMTVHGSHHGLIRDNVYYNVDGSCFATEDGSEFGNVITDNFACRANGGSVGVAGLGTNINDLGDQGDGFWLAGPFNVCDRNVAANCIRAGFTLFPDNVPHVRQNRRNQEVFVPKFPGANLMEEDERDVLNVRWQGGVFSGNEVYGATTAGINLWTCGDFHNFPDKATPNRISDMVIWHATGCGGVFYYAHTFHVNGWIQRGQASMMHASVRDGGHINPSSGPGMHMGGAGCAVLIAENVDIQGMTVGFFQRGRGAATEIVLRDAVLDNYVNVRIKKWAQVPAGDNVRDFLMERVVFGEHAAHDELSNITMEAETPGRPDTGGTDPLVPELNLIRDCLIRGQRRDLDLYYLPEQLPTYVLEEGAFPDRPGITNQEAWDEFGRAFAGRMVPDAPPTPAEATSLALSLGIKNAGVY